MIFNKNLLKNEFILTVILMENQSQEENTLNYKVIDTKSEKLSRSSFLNDIREDEKYGIEHKFEVVSEKPIEFIFNMIYILADGSRMWVYLSQDEDNAERVNAEIVSDEVGDMNSNATEVTTNES